MLDYLYNVLQTVDRYDVSLEDLNTLVRKNDLLIKRLKAHNFRYAIGGNGKGGPGESSEARASGEEASEVGPEPEATAPTAPAEAIPGAGVTPTTPASAEPGTVTIASVGASEQFRRIEAEIRKSRERAEATQRLTDRLNSQNAEREEFMRIAVLLAEFLRELSSMTKVTPYSELQKQTDQIIELLETYSGPIRIREDPATGEAGPSGSAGSGESGGVGSAEPAGSAGSAGSASNE